MTSISSNYLNLLGGTVPPPAAPALPQATAASTVPSAPADAVKLSAAATAAPTAAAPSGDPVAQEVGRLRQEITSLTQQLDALEKALAARKKPATPTPATPTAAGEYTTKGGDYLWKIAKEQLGDGNRWKEIYDLNKEAIGPNPNLLYPGVKLKMPAKSGTTPTTPSPTAPVPTTDSTDVPVSAPTRAYSDAEIAALASAYKLSPDRANVQAFIGEMDSYERAYKGRVFGPGIESIATTPQEQAAIKQSVAQLQQALDILIKSGKLKPTLANGQPVTGLAATGSYYKLDAQGRELKDAAGNPVMEESFLAAITKFKQDQKIHQTYKLADGTYGINEYVGPTTIEALKKALLAK